MSPIRSVLSRLWHLPQRLLHGRRRREAVRNLRSQGPVEEMVFVCEGNICRSPFAEELSRRRIGELAGEEVNVRSAGFIGPDRPSPPAARRVAQAWDVDLSEHRSRLVDVPRLAAGPATLIFVMESGQRKRLTQGGVESHRVFRLGLFDPRGRQRTDIRDPVFASEEAFREVYRRIDRCVSSVLRNLEVGDKPPEERADEPG